MAGQTPAPLGPHATPNLTTYHPPAWNPTCGWTPAAPAGTPCGQPATWHILWTATPNPDGGSPATFACDPHMAVLNTRFTYQDRHRTTAGCDMPGADWSFTELRCAPTAE